MRSPEKPYATEGNLSAVLHEARFAGGIAAGGQRSGFSGNMYTRDALRMMLDTMDHYPAMTRELLGILPQLQGTKNDAATNESLDALPHQVFRQVSGGIRLSDKQVEIAEYWTHKWGVPLETSEAEGKHFTIYNSSDGPLLYIITLAKFSQLPAGRGVMNGMYTHRPTGDTRTIGEAARRCVDFIMRSISWSQSKGSGLYVVPNTNPLQTSPSGVMRDGFDSYYYPNGDIGEPVDFSFMAYIDNQALAFEALTVAATVLFPDDPLAPTWLATAAKLRERTNELAWMGNTYATAVDLHNQPVNLEGTAALEPLNGPFLHFADGPDYVRALVEWLYCDDVMTPIGPRMISRKFERFEGEYYAYQGTGTVWPYVNGVIARGLRNSWGLYTPSRDLGVDRTLGFFNRTGEAVELGFVDREFSQPDYNPYRDRKISIGAATIAAADLGQLDQGWSATAGLREIWDWQNGFPHEKPGTWQNALARRVLELIEANPPASAGQPAQEFYIDFEKGERLKDERARAMNLAA